MKTPYVYLIGAGPGEAELITLKAVRVLSEADCVIYDALANPSLLKYASSAAETISVGKRGGQESIKQEQINKLLVDKANEGKTVARLKGGDPMLFARGGEEAAALRKAGIGFEVVPGITSGMAAAEYSGVFLTDRDTSSQVVFVTGHPAGDKDFDAIDWDYLAKFDGSVVLYMAMGNLAQIAERFIAAGMAADTPVAVVQNATLPSQKLAQGPLNQIDAICKARQLAAPAIVMIGKAAQEASPDSWFMNKPLFGKTVVITRDKEGNERIGAMLCRQAAQVIDFPCIQLQHAISNPELKRAVREMSDYEWVVFTSSHGVDFTFEALAKMGKDSRAFGHAKIACIGKPTASTLLRYGIRADFVPTEYTARVMAEELSERYDLRRNNMLLLRSAIATNELSEMLRRKGAAVEDLRIYTTVTVTLPEEERKALTDKIAANQVDWVTFTSSSTVEGFFANIPIETVKQSSIKLASIGPETTHKLEALGLKVHLEAQPHTAEGLVEALAAQSKS